MYRRDLVSAVHEVAEQLEDAKDDVDGGWLNASLLDWRDLACRVEVAADELVESIEDELEERRERRGLRRFVEATRRLE